MHGKRILLGVTGGIAAYKAAALTSKMVQAGAHVDVIMTESAARFITPLTLQTLSRNRVHIDTFDEQDPSVVSHIHLADHADLIIIAPATANTIAKLAGGFADDMLSTTLLAATCPILIAPAMNVHMYEHPAVVDNMKLLADRGVMFIEPGTGQLACGYVAKGRLAEPEDIMAAASRWFGRKELLKGKRVLVTAGGTMERLDPVRYLTNDSSGKMGFAIAEAARTMGAEVTVIKGRTSVAAPAGVRVIQVESAEQMLEQATALYPNCDIVVKAAAVADYRPVVVADQKIKKKGDRLLLELERTTDILETLGERKEHQFLIGFAAETEQVERYAMDKLRRKNCDWIVANDVSAEGAGFDGDTNILSVYGPDGLVEALPLMSKRSAAERLMELAAAAVSSRGGEPE
ncbi:bifunctional phosphopantothenoylcysteine decarboxylase/phosphopantothenate--cysteine ligase CoaBC [Paenibacillus sp. J5C_2022]|uniref:bifunctional phosphopantothenoylcysteine decarboxylase/phosphopantothenate--cysteine ligase CoaBC n=1 Tax=Paenibacillus sp. J5C2022 TaxID=2977129 RepID=UPI0021D2C773|nr:bifunctional phosphopantothenoylcysteine decarboxylase/phosphopantothenate--cysteine ligase CoaBC [Paenibacillus sp. J5C2022]MCU6708956.1 bifunctional phosphopantothenoylcysteine decarboxylase/phosphopantothenate--cysteine ligase CoaBC [Paenibacillus sp. J5C2022]